MQQYFYAIIMHQEIRSVTKYLCVSLEDFLAEVYFQLTSFFHARRDFSKHV